MSAFQANMPLYQSITNLADENEEMRRHLQSRLQNVETELLEMAGKQKRNAAVIDPDGFVSLPETRIGRSARRIRPFGSPQKRKRGPKRRK
jgi:hypothetical protein